MPLFVQIFSLVSGITCLLCAFYQFYKIVFKSRNFIKIIGTVKKHQKSYGKKTMYYAVITYDFEGNVYEIASSIATNAQRLLPSIGSPIEIKVNPNKPEEATFAQFKDYIGMFLILLINGIIFTSLGIFGAS